MSRMLGGLILLALLAAASPAAPVYCERGAPRTSPVAHAGRDASPGSQDSQLTKPEFARWLKEHAALLGELDKTLAVPASRPVDVMKEGWETDWRSELTAAELRAEDTLLQTLRAVCLTYVRAAPAQRESIRRMFDERETALWYLRSYTSHAAEQIRSKEDAEWLLVGLAAASIQDNRVDFRDTYVSLGRLYIRSVEKGIAPGTYFKRVGLLSSKAPSVDGQVSMYEFLLGFEKSAFFKYEVAPNLPRRGSP